MMEFFSDLCAPELPFLRYALLTAAASSVAFGIVGSYVAIRKLSSLAGAIAHAVLGGVGLAIYLQRVHHCAWAHPLAAAALAAVAAALLIGCVSLFAREREDTAIGVVWAFGMSAGLLFLARTPGYVDLQGYLFGNILLLNRQDLYWTLLLDGAVLIPALIFYHDIVAVCFDPVHAGLRKLPVHRIYLLVLVLVALTIVLMVHVMGIILVIALLTLPAAAANCYVRQLGPMMVLSCLLSLLFSTGGLCTAYQLDLPSGPAIALLACCVYLLSLLWRRLRDDQVLRRLLARRKKK